MYNIRKGKCSPIQKTSVEADYCHYVQSECRSDVSPITVDRLPVFSARYRVLPLWFGHVWTKCTELKQLFHQPQPTSAFSAVFQCPGSVSSLGFLPLLVLKQYHWEEAARTLHGPDPLTVTQPTVSKALKETQSTYPNYWPGLVLFSSITGLLIEGTLLSSDASSLTTIHTRKCKLHKYVITHKWPALTYMTMQIISGE